MPRVGFEPTIPTFERSKTVHVLDCAATAIGTLIMGKYIIVTIMKMKLKIQKYSQVLI
jgi:hypothetical protein